MDIKKIILLLLEERYEELNDYIEGNHYEDDFTKKYKELTSPKKIEKMKELMARWDKLKERM